MSRDNAVVRNRRLRYFDLHLADGEYMSEESMRERDPAGWTHFVGDERRRGNDDVNSSSSSAFQGLGGFFVTTMERQQQRFAEYIQNEAERQREEDLKKLCGDLKDDRDQEDEMGEMESVAERLEAWKDLHKMAFLSGNDSGFDYSVVDDNDEYDNRAQQRRDDEDKWFDEDD